jgi:hypothetical protein
MEMMEIAQQDGVIQSVAARARSRVHPDEECGVTAFFEKRRVLRPLVLHDELARRIEVLRDERVEGPSLPGAMAVHDDDLGGRRIIKKKNRGVDLLRVELAHFIVQRLAAGRLFPLDDPGDTLHVRDDVNAHSSSLGRRRKHGKRTIHQTEEEL